MLLLRMGRRVIVMNTVPLVATNNDWWFRGRLLKGGKEDVLLKKAIEMRKW